MSQPGNTVKASEIRSTSIGIKILLVSNIAAYGLLFFGDTMQILDDFALHYLQSDLFAIHQLITHMFLHGGTFHLFINLFVLWMFGVPLENIWGTGRFLVFYLICGLGAAGLYLFTSTFTVDELSNLRPPIETQMITQKDEKPLLNLVDYQHFSLMHETQNDGPANEDGQYYQDPINMPMLGASGAIFGILLAFGMIFPNTRILVFFFFPMKAKYFVIVLGALQLYLGISDKGSNVAYFAHLGGMIFAFILLQFWGSKSLEIER